VKVKECLWRLEADMAAWRAMEDELCRAMKIRCTISWLDGATKLVKSSVLVY